MRRIMLFIVACALLAVPLLVANGQEAPAADLPWPIRLGLRVRQVETSIPLIDRVVLVPDAATYVDELSRWSPRGRWPVLFEDDTLTPMFIRRFAPQEVMRREPVSRDLDDDDAHRRALTGAIVRAWGGDAEAHSPAETFAAQRHAPPGIVCASVNDPAWTAAVAFAAGRGQLLVWLDDDFGRPNQVLDHEQVMRLVAAVEGALDESGYDYDELGDTIETITLCRAMGGAAEVNLPEDANAQIPGRYGDGPRAITDLIGRHDFGPRYAFAGWIFGDETRCAYVAMCSLVLPREHVWLCNTYGDGPNWRPYATTDAARTLNDADYTTDERHGNDAASAAWLRMLGEGLTTDLVLMNSRGNVDFFHATDERLFVNDVPILNTPAAVHLIHSWSMRNPARSATVGGRWLDRGAYAYVGAVHEPLLNAFVPPALVSERLTGFVPLLVAARWWDDQGPFSAAWKVNTFGDPLMLCPPRRAPQLVDQRTGEAADLPQVTRRVEPAGRGEDLFETARRLMRRAAEEPTAEHFAEAIELLTRLGQDEIALQMWRIAGEHGATGPAAPFVLGPLFRAGRTDEFVTAFAEVETPSALHLDMLWHLLTTRLGPRTGASILRLLETHVREPAHVDLQRLAPHLHRAFGIEHTREAIQRHLDQADRDRDRQALLRLLETY